MFTRGWAAVAHRVSVAEAAAEAGLPVRFCALPDGARAMARGLGGLWREVAAADRLMVGDPFSGLIQALLPAVGAAGVVVVDDGTATLEFADALASGAGLSRWDRDDVGCGWCASRPRWPSRSPRCWRRSRPGSSWCRSGRTGGSRG